MLSYLIWSRNRLDAVWFLKGKERYSKQRRVKMGWQRPGSKASLVFLCSCVCVCIFKARNRLGSVSAHSLLVFLIFLSICLSCRAAPLPVCVAVVMTAQPIKIQTGNSAETLTDCCWGVWNRSPRFASAILSPFLITRAQTHADKHTQLKHIGKQKLKKHKQRKSESVSCREEACEGQHKIYKIWTCVRLYGAYTQVVRIAQRQETECWICNGTSQVEVNDDWKSVATMKWHLIIR